MKIVSTEILVSNGAWPSSSEWTNALAAIEKAVRAVVWPVGSANFKINPVKHGNGVKPIKQGFLDSLKNAGWATEGPIRLNSGLKPGNIDVMLKTSAKPIAIEWETGNVSSCHRSMNKLCLGLVEGAISAGVLVLPSRKLYQYLTDRVANYNELEPYIPFWSAIEVKNGALAIIVIEHDSECNSVLQIPKMTDGMSSQAKRKSN